MLNRIIPLGFVFAGLVNIVGILVITGGMTRDSLALADPGVFSSFGIIAIMLWGAAYIATAPLARQSVWLPLVFALEKLVYAVNWALWRPGQDALIDQIASRDDLGAFFLQSYGLNDGLFCLFFLAVAIFNWRQPQPR